MIIQSHRLKSIVANLDENKVQRIKDFVQGAVYCFCKNCPNQWFAVKDLFGGENFYWQKTPLFELYTWHAQKRESDAIEMAGKDVGWILLNVLHFDKRTFELKRDYVNIYKWTGEEKNDDQ